jgi:hypothetical protein
MKQAMKCITRIVEILSDINNILSAATKWKALYDVEDTANWEDVQYLLPYDIRKVAQKAINAKYDEGVKDGVEDRVE